MTDSTIHIFQNKAWYFLSIYYSRDKWPELISQIEQFCTGRQEQFSDCLISLSEERGEHIRVALSSLDCIGDYQPEITAFFRSYLKVNPSFSIQPVLYGKTIWCNYPNNTLVWNRFRLWDHTDRYIRLHQDTFQLVLKLLENDHSSDNIFSLGIYLFTKGLSCIDNNERMDALSRALCEISNEFAPFNYSNTAKELMNKLDLREVDEAIELYLNEDENSYSSELINWLDKSKAGVKFYGYRYFCSLICQIIGLTGLRQIMILELMDMWYNRTYNE
jgi:hypothetical protein